MTENRECQDLVQLSAALNLAALLATSADWAVSADEVVEKAVGYAQLLADVIERECVDASS